MQETVLGRTGLRVSVACLGAGGHSRLGMGTGKSTSESVAVVKAALDAGVTIVDTAAAYGTEEIVGEALEGVRDRVVLSTKGTVAVKGERPGEESNLTPAGLRATAEASLRRLRTDYIDIYHLHGVAPGQYDYCVDALVPELERLRDEGKIRFLGITERFNADTNHQMLERATTDDFWDVVMVGYNLINQTAARKTLPATRQRHIGTLCMFAVRWGLVDLGQAKTLIAELIRRGEVDPGALDPDDPFGFLVDDGRRIPLTEAAYRFCRHSAGIDVVMTGTGNRRHLEENIHAIGMPPLPDPVVEKLRHAFGRVTSASGDAVAKLG
jgi:L-galactose dehydrogenase